MAEFTLPPARPDGGPTQPPPKPKPAVIIRQPDGSYHDVTKHARELWDLLEAALHYDRLDYEEVEAALALGILAKFPVAHLQRHVDSSRRYRAEQVVDARKREAREKWLNEEVLVVPAHPFKPENEPDRPGARSKPGEPTYVSRGYAQRLDGAAVILRPCPHVWAGEPA